MTFDSSESGLPHFALEAEPSNSRARRGRESDADDQPKPFIRNSLSDAVVLCLRSALTLSRERLTVIDEGDRVVLIVMVMVRPLRVRPRHLRNVDLHYPLLLRRLHLRPR